MHAVESSWVDTFWQFRAFGTMSVLALKDVEEVEQGVAGLGNRHLLSLPKSFGFASVGDCGTFRQLRLAMSPLSKLYDLVLG